jgi:hypothetical protein
MTETSHQAPKVFETAADIKRYGWRLTTPKEERHVLAVLLPDALHPVLNGTFRVEDDVEDSYAKWQEHETFWTVCPLSSIMGVRVHSAIMKKKDQD